jgi:hypothetical protein
MKKFKFLTSNLKTIENKVKIQNYVSHMLIKFQQKKLLANIYSHINILI